MYITYLQITDLHELLWDIVPENRDSEESLSTVRIEFKSIDKYFELHKLKFWVNWNSLKIMIQLSTVN